MKQEVRRGRKFVEYHDPDTQDEGTFTQEISGADVSYQDEGGIWRQLVEDWETDGADGFSFRASRMNHKVRFDSIGAWRWYPRRNVETEYLILNRPQCWLTATKRWGNLLVNGISREGKDITITSVRKVTRVIHSRWNGIKTDWILEDASAPTRFRQKIDLVGITEVDGVLYGADGERLASLMPTTATDANGAELACTGTYSGGYVEFSADVTGAAFPVVVDPDYGCGDGGDTMVGHSSVTLRNYGATVQQMHHFNTLYRFILSSIPSGSICSACSIALTVTANEYTGDGSSTLSFFKVTDANGDWVEGTKDSDTAGEGEPCYAYKKYSATTPTNWAGSAGMTTAGTDYVNTVLGSFTWLHNETVGTQKSATFNASGLSVIQSWFGEATNNGLVAVTTAGYNFRSPYSAFAEHATASYRPVLTVTYTTGGALRRINMSSTQQLNGGANG